MEKVKVNGYDYNWFSIRWRFDAIKESFPRTMAATAQKFFVDSFRRQGWYEAKGLKRWKARQKPDKGSKKRGILIKSGRLWRSIRIREATFGNITIAAEAPYAAAHNFGIDGPQHVRAHTRYTRVTIKEQTTTKTGKVRNTTRKVEGRAYTVRAHTRNMQLPQRQFMGPNRVLDVLLTREINKALETVFNK